MIQKIAAQTGRAFELIQGQKLRVTDPEGQQVADLFCFSKLRPEDALSSGRSIDYNDSLLFSTGQKLFAQSGRIMLEIKEDTCGRHDFLVTPCSQQMFEMISGKADPHPSCLENLEVNLKPYAVNLHQITTTFNIFMNVNFRGDGRIAVVAPISRPGDHIVFEAKMDLIVGLTACSDEQTNNGRCKPIEFEIF